MTRLATRVVVVGLVVACASCGGDGGGDTGGGDASGDVGGGDVGADVGEVGGDDTSAPSLTLVTAEQTALPGESVVFEVEGVPAGEEATWSIASATVAGLDCGGAVEWTTSEGRLEIVAPRRFEEARCADALEVTARVQGAEAVGALRFELSPGWGQRWEPVEGWDNPVVPLPACPTWNCLGNNDPTLARGDDGRLVVWFAAGGDRGEHPVVGRAVETDGVFALDPEEPIMEPTGEPQEARPWDDIRETVSVYRAPGDDRWTMTYLGYATDYFTDPSIGLVRSDDAEGRSFPRAEAPIYTPTRPGGWDESFITSPNALMGPDGVMRIYFTGASVNALGGKIGLLTSADGGDTWTPHPDNPVFEGRLGEWDESVLDSYVVFYGGRYVMWYTAFPEPLTANSMIALGMATSEDGVTWERVTEAPILAPGPSGSWYDLQIAAGEVLVEEDGSLLMTVYGVPMEGPLPDFPDFRPERIGLFRAPAD